MSEELRLHAEHYLASSIHTASPAKLRLMLIERSVQVATTLARLWREPATSETNVNEHSITLLDLLNELLSGVTDKESELGQKVADLYVFLCQHLLAAEDNRDAAAVDEIRLVLETEAETWRMVCAQETPIRQPGQVDQTAMASEGGFDFSG